MLYLITDTVANGQLCRGGRGERKRERKGEGGKRERGGGERKESKGGGSVNNSPIS